MLLTFENIYQGFVGGGRFPHFHEEAPPAGPDDMKIEGGKGGGSVTEGVWNGSYCSTPGLVCCSVCVAVCVCH